MTHNLNNSFGTANPDNVISGIAKRANDEPVARDGFRIQEGNTFV